MELREVVKIRDTPSGMYIIYDAKKFQYGGSVRVRIKPQATRPQVNSRRINHMAGIDNAIPLYFY